MNRLNRYARAGSVLGLLPNPLTRVDLSTPLRPEPPKPGGTNPPSGSTPPAPNGHK
jgi:hypothetical protein